MGVAESIGVSAPEPTRRVGWGFIALFALAYAGTWLALLTPVLVTIALKLHQLAPGSAADNQSLVLATGAFFAMIGNPLFGRLSDRTTSGFGMRRPWLVGGMLSGCAALLLIATAQTVAMVLIGWCLAQLAFNAVLASIIAVLPDQVPLVQRGTVAGILGICLPLGQVGGTFLVDSVSNSTLTSFMLPAAIGLIAVLLFTLALADRRQNVALQPLPALREIATWYWVNPRRYPDFAWAWLSRCLLVLGTAFLNTYQPYYLESKLGYAMEQTPALIARGTLVQASAIVALSILGGRLSDAIRRRKAFVLVGASIYAAGLWIIAGATSYSTFLLGMLATGIGHGIYFAVDLALVTDVLPNRQRDAAKDLGILNIANALPQSLAPALGPAILAVGGGNYTWVFLTAGAVALCGSFAILPVKSVR
jgi:MFS family permease